MAKEVKKTAAVALSKSDKDAYLKLLEFVNFKSSAAKNSGKSEREICILFLAENGVDDVEKDPMKDIIEYCLAFTNSSPSQLSDEEELDELAKEVDDDDEEELLEEGSDDDEEEVAQAPKKATAAAKPKTVAAATPAKPAAPAKTVAPKVTAAKSESGAVKFDGRNIPAHAKIMKTFLSKWFDFAKLFKLDFLKQGATVRMLLENSEPTIINFDEVKVNADGSMSGNIYLNRFKSVAEIEPMIDEFVDDKKIGMFRGESHPSIKGVTTAELTKFFDEQEVLKIAKDRAAAMDKKTGINRVAMEQKIQEETAPKAKAATEVKAKAKK